MLTQDKPLTADVAYALNHILLYLEMTGVVEASEHLGEPTCITSDLDYFLNYIHCPFKVLTEWYGWTSEKGKQTWDTFTFE